MHMVGGVNSSLACVPTLLQSILVYFLISIPPENARKP